mmetsp:Transcript_25143/g.36975  ORF Transcript_25143/g.36975 Transcript_25143/m.36975 type:complete len:160 (-) Transcript_25143:474-953(-)|eukprot:CAMPEP_0195508124 /NCGR_PEP_ID=MMETSP0794_2-20130614/1424_1 /TAXON_ID=515487 /ORGANISM="Stephanopyxis turris, Strain CCMP 815" /LENGTH=159 /DNA_ID=CAMNT_0040635011 /DNA_START=70 /DNA_END=549 /DNA_ORIENTATION=-
MQAATGMVPFASDAAAVGFGAVCGALCRHQLGKMAAEKIASDPAKFGHLTGWHTAGINILGSFTLGGIAGTPLIDAPKQLQKKVSCSSPQFGLTPRMKLLLGVGFCGSFTTFSTYSVDVFNMMQSGQLLRALSYVMANNAGGIIAAGTGMVLVKKLFTA